MPRDWRKMGRPRKQPRVLNGERYWWCTQCRRYRHEDEMTYDKRMHSGVGSWCADCKREYNRVFMWRQRQAKAARRESES
jgi:hypothetical protein